MDKQYYLLLLLFSINISCCSQTIHKIEYRNSDNLVINEKSIEDVDIYKKLYYAKADLKYIEIINNNKTKKDSLGNKLKKIISVEYYYSGNDSKVEIRKKYPKESWDFSFFFVKRKRIGKYFADYKEKEIKIGELACSENKNYLIDENGRTLCEIIQNNCGQNNSIKITKYLYDKLGNKLLIANFDAKGTGTYYVFDKKNKLKSVETFKTNEFLKMKKMYFKKVEIEYYKTNKLEP